MPQPDLWQQTDRLKFLGSLIHLLTYDFAWLDQQPAKQAKFCSETLKESNMRIPDVHRKSMNPAETWRADFQFRRKQSLTGSSKNLEAVNQTRMPVFLPVRLLGSVAVVRSEPGISVEFSEALVPDGRDWHLRFDAFFPKK